QDNHAEGVFFEDFPLGDLETQRFRKEPTRDKFTQYALTVEGKIANFDVTYAGAYMHRPTYGVADYMEYSYAYDVAYEASGGNAYYYYFQNDAGDIVDPTQYIIGRNNFKKLSQELRVASPADRPLRVIAGLFYQRQSNDIFQDYRVDGLGSLVSVNGIPGTV